MSYFPPISPYTVGFASKCPRCGQGDLFQGFLNLQPACSVCNLDFSKTDSGDGPAVFIAFIVGFVAIGLAFVARFVWGASMPVAFVLSAGVSTLLIGVLLRPFKATLIALQYQNEAEEKRRLE